MEAPVLSVQNITKTYAGTPALRDVSLDLNAGEVVGLVGENGAGKSTLLNIVSGVIQPDSGHIVVHGAPAVVRSYHEANRLGIFRVFQEGALVPNLSVYDNLLLSHERHFNRLGVFLDRRRMKRAAQQMLREAGLPIAPGARVQDLTLSSRQAVEIARATFLSSLLGIDRPIILLDEPTTALDAREERATIELIQRLRGTATFILVSHRLQEILEVSDRIVVLKDGELVGQISGTEADEATLHRMMVGREQLASETNDPTEALRREGSASALLHARNVTRPGAFRDVSLTLREGEILGIGGLEGSGKSDLGQVLAGVVKPSAGTIEIRGGRAPQTLRGMMSRGVVYMPGDRQLDGLILSASIATNIVLPSIHDRYTNRLGILRLKKARETVRAWMERLRIVARSSRQVTETLSGGQQQKVLFAKYLSREPRLLILENPTRGVDVNTKAEIYRVLRELASGGAGVVLVSDDLLELIGLSDRIMIMAHGRVVDVLDATADKPTEEELVRLMLAPTARVSSQVSRPPGPHPSAAPLAQRHPPM